MKRLADILQFWMKVMYFVFLATGLAAFVLLLAAGGWGKVSLLTRVFYALISGAANGIFSGTLAVLILALIAPWKTRRVVKQNKKKLARREQRRQHLQKTTKSA